MSQNRSAADRAGVVAGLLRERGDAALARRSAGARRQRLIERGPQVRGLPGPRWRPIAARAPSRGDGGSRVARSSWPASSRRRGAGRRAVRGHDRAARARLHRLPRQARAAPRRDGYYPRIAGKPAGYLFNQLRNFRDGRRHYELMNGLLALLDDAYLREIADHFAVARPALSAAARAGRGRRRCCDAGEALVRRGDPARGMPACNDCHGAR